MAEKEGVVKFRSRFTQKPPISFDVLQELNAWRKKLFEAGLIGQDPDCYGGAGFGNVSQRLPYKNGVGKRTFVITGTQTGKIENLTEEHYVVVTEYYPEQNLVVAEGPIEPSSESMTHGAVYDNLDDSLWFIFHSHSPSIWQSAERLEIPVTAKNVEYGTPEMVKEVTRLFSETDVLKKRIFSMAGHEDGIISFGKTAEEAGKVMLNYLARSQS